MIVYNSTTGELLYTLGQGGTSVNENRTSTGFQTVYGNMPTGGVGLYTLANGRAYTFVNEHSASTPLLKTAQLRCINIATGTEEWIYSSFGGVWSLYVDTLIGASGYLVQLNNYDENLYCFGQGPTATTVVGPQNVTEAGQKMVIEGTVLDTSPGTYNTVEREGRFPNGLAAVSDVGDNMTKWMEYVYMNRPRPDVKGVPVTLSVVDSAGTATDIATVTSDSTGYYSYVYTPEQAGNFTLVARFDGSNGYYPSAAQTTFGVAAAPETPAPPPPETPPMTDTYVLASAIGIIIALAVVGAIVIVVLKRR
jgi:hypothetical protein